MIFTDFRSPCCRPFLRIWELETEVERAGVGTRSLVCFFERIAAVSFSAMNFTAVSCPRIRSSWPRKELLNTEKLIQVGLHPLFSRRSSCVSELGAGDEVLELKRWGRR
ncbi:hypothetical protein Salat_0701500 [Sesamum alatum]|uniref:Uncharacterized protein n=1 Tax=Sesamum alatum TaxID=300844 RepID=A0AAE2CUS8_9LAMI|nr:hypothetical protein Salat_0701500 [Sesamum alatum]